ncbi:hypothetical protein BDZ45DRAFT_722447 [Acephala macrosclerotiorum]|nr:hypothetical protein BDZ45DRAFT_722447 [Acephala macrosclerotiorum]
MDDAFEDAAPETASPPPKKRSLFSSAAIAKSNAAEEAVEFFSRAKELYPQILAQEERKRQKRSLKLERKRSSTSADTKEITPPEDKRRRVSAQSKMHDEYSSDESRNHNDDSISRVRMHSSHSSPGSRHSRQGSDSRSVQACPTSLSARYNRDLTTPKPQSLKPTASTGCITLSDSEDGEPTMKLSVRRSPKKQLITLIDSDDGFSSPQKPAKSAVVEEELFSDEEFPELVKAAKERAMKKAEEAARSAKAFGEQNHASNDDEDDIFETGSANSDPTVELLISSEMKDTTALRVKRKISQKLAEVRHAWCDRQIINGQPMTLEMKKEVFLTYRNHKLYDFSTLQGLGLKVDEHGNLVSSTDSISPDGRVHLEAWTNEAHETWLKREAAKKKKEEGDDDDVEKQKQPPVKKTRLVLKSKNLPDFKLMVKPSTTAERLADAFRDANDLGDEKTITLHLDGDELDPSDKVEDLDLEDMDTLEVHVK